MGSGCWVQGHPACHPWVYAAGGGGWYAVADGRRQITMEELHHDTYSTNHYPANRRTVTAGAAGFAIYWRGAGAWTGHTRFLRRTAQTYGDIASLPLGSQRMLLVSHPALIEDVLVTQGRIFPKEDITQMRNSTDYLLFGTGLLTSNGEFWLRQRRMAQPAFHRQRIASYAEAWCATRSRCLRSGSLGRSWICTRQ